MKRKVKEAMSRWRKGKVNKEVYLKERKEWREHCKEKEREWKENEMEKIRNLKNENEIWNFLKGVNKKREKVENEISDEQWMEHFRKLLEGSDEMKIGQARRREEDREEEEKLIITEAEIKLAWNMLKKKKAAGFDGIPNEAWIFGGKGINGMMVELIKKIWSGEGIPEDWKTGIIVPLHKKGDINQAKNYRGITLLSTAYKIYTEVLRRRLVKEVEEKGILGEGQAGFRKGRSTIENIFILDHLSQMAKIKKEKLYALFIDLRAAFDMVDRNLLWDILEKVGISKYLIERIKELYTETKYRNEGKNTGRTFR